MQRVDYISDALGFRVAATNLPIAPKSTPVAPVPQVATPVVVAPVPFAAAPIPAVQATVNKVPIAAVKAAEEPAIDVRTGFAPSVAETIAQAPAVQAPAAIVSPTYYAAPYAATYGYQPAVVAPVVAAPAVTSSQYHAQSEVGEYNYGYSNQNSAKSESKTADGVVRGSYSYIDANGIQQTANYIADDIFGFRVAATNLPVAPVAAH